MIVEVSQLSSYMHNLFLSWSFAMIKFLKSSLFIIDSPYNSVEEITIVICALIIVFLIFWLVLLKTNTNNRQKSNLDIQIKLKEQIDFDSMLGVYNREAFYRFTEKLLIDNPKMDFSIVCFDIYRFKLYNDLFGVSAGDELLKKVAKVIKDSIPKNATYGKFYADHFIACIPSKAMDFDALDKQINKIIKNEKYGFDIKLKFGIYKIEDKTISVDKMSKWANMALDKINDKKDVNVVYFDEELKNRIQDEKDIMTDFEQAIKMHQFLVYLQPIYSISRDAIVGAEALVRWNHPSKGLLLPGKFISILEKNDIITELDYYVWEEVCKFIQKRKKEGKEDLSISVNVSRLELYDPNFVSNIKQLLDKYDVTPQQFKLEITETLYAESPEQFLGSIAELQKMGFQVLMDDFGSGYSSLNVLRDLPVDAIKIDLRFLENFELSSRAGNIFTSVIRMAKWLNISIIAEGVETSTQVEFLKSVGCGIIQGYYFSRPLTIEDFEKLVKDDKKMLMENEELQFSFEELDVLFGGNILTSRMFNNMACGVGLYELINDELEVIRVNNTYYEIIGYNPETFYKESKSISKKLHKDDKKILLDACKEVLNTKKGRKIIARRYIDSDKVLYLDCYIRYIGGIDSHPLLSISFNDITSEVETREKFRKQSEFLENMYENMMCGIIQFAINGTTKVMSGNKAACQMLGFSSSKELIDNLNDPKFGLILPESTIRIKEIIEEIKDSKKSQSIELMVSRFDGESILIRSTFNLIENADKVKVVQAEFIDISNEVKCRIQL